MTSSCNSSSSSNFFPGRCFFRWRNKWKSLGYYKKQQFLSEFPLDVHFLRWEIVWRNAPRIWRDFGSALPIQTRLTQIKPVLPLSNEHGSQVKDQGRRQCCHNKHKKFPYRPTRDVSLLSRHASYKPYIQWDRNVNAEFMTTVSIRYNNCILYGGNVLDSTKFSYGCINIVCGVEKMSFQEAQRW